MASNTESPSSPRSTTSNQNYYDLLGISQTATEEEIKRAYRKAALRLHPDKNPDPEAATQFQAVDKAYKVLIDPKLRSTYDQLGPRAADAMRRMNDEYSEILARMPKWKKILFTILCISTCCCFGGGCCCLCGFGCCCNFCCNHCCGKYQRENEDANDFSPFQDDEGVKETNPRSNTTVTSPIPQETDPVLRQPTISNENTAIPMPTSYEATSVTSQ